MYPVLLDLGFVSINSYGILIATGFLLSLVYIAKNADGVGLISIQQQDATFWMFIFGMIGGRLLHVITQGSHYWQNPTEIVQVWKGGFVFYGWLIGAIPTVIYHGRKYGFSPWDTFDLVSPGFALAHGVGRLGCFLAGCCYGTPSDLPWAVKFDSFLVARDFRNIHLHPTQLYSAALLFGLAFFLHKKLKKRKYSGQIALTYFFLYAIIRSLLEIVRGDEEREYIIDTWLSTSQGISILVLIVIAFLFSKRKQHLV